MTEIESTVTVESLIYRPSKVDGAHVYMIGENNWVLRHDGDYWLASRHRSARRISAHTTMAQVRSMLDG